MSIDKTQGIILKKIDIRETSVIATFYTKEFGKIKGLLKGVREDPNKVGSPLELFSNNDIVFYRKIRSEIHLISHCDLKENFSEIRKDLGKIYLASYIVMLIDLIVASEDKNEEIFNLMVDFFNSLSTRDDISHLEKLFEIKLLALSGFKPYFDACIVCSKKITKQAHFSLKLGGLICSDCIAQDRAATHISEGAIASLLHLEQESWGQALRLRLSKVLDQELSLMLKQFLNFHTGIDLRIKTEFNKLDLALVSG